MQVKPLSPEDVTINGVKPYEVVNEEVLKKLGTPKEIKESNGVDGRFKDYIYPNFIMSTYFENDQIEKIMLFKITNSNFKTSRGIIVGDDVKKLFEKYGVVKLEEDRYYYEYIPKSDFERSYLMVVKVKNNKIQEILFQ